MRSKVLSISVFFVFITIAFGSASSRTFSLYSDRRGKRVGDIVTVLIIESSKASNESGTNTEKNHGVTATGSKGGGLLDFIPSFGLGAQTTAKYDGKGKTKRQGSLKAKVTARITEVLDNGNMFIEGNKTVEINSEKELLEVSGIIRAEDVGSDNTVYSYNIADAKITYAGSGSVYNGQRPGIFARFFNWIF